MTDLQKLAKKLAADDRLWNTQEVVEKNLLAALEQVQEQTVAIMEARQIAAHASEPYEPSDGEDYRDQE